MSRGRKMTIETNSQDETKELGRAIGERLEAGDVVCLTGLSAGSCRGAWY